jgi:hypothetical protein
MAEPPTTTRAAAVTAERDVLATKLHVPQTRRGFVAAPGSPTGSPSRTRPS